VKKLVLAAGGVLALAVTVWAEGKNLQHFPKYTKIEDLKAEMGLIKRSLGVDCAYCHRMQPTRDMAFDTEKKKVARAMLEMQKKLNEKCFTPGFLGMKKAPRATCYMCHHGHDEVETKPDKPEDEKKFNDFVESGKKKKVVEGMKKLVDELNETFFTWKDAPKATCWMCHRGEVEWKHELPREAPEDKKPEDKKEPD
jgi:hypothetical protein